MRRRGQNMIRSILGLLVGLVVAIAGVGLFVWLLWWLWSQRDEDKEPPAIEIQAESPAAEPRAGEKALEKEVSEEEAEVEEGTEEQAEPETEDVQEQPSEPDDLKRIEGIGPKISSVLQKAAITTYAQLAETDVSRLEQILEEADPRLLRLANPTSWPEQAALAAAGEWEALGAFQSELKRGR
jgi:small subunit ribosomal protein S2